MSALKYFAPVLVAILLPVSGAATAAKATKAEAAIIAAPTTAPMDSERAALLAESKSINSTPAIAKLVEAASASPDSPEPWYNLGYAHMQAGINTQSVGDLQLAARYLNKVLAMVPGNQSVLNALYSVYYDDTFNNRYINAYELARANYLQLSEATRITLNPPALAKFAALLIWQEKNHQPNRQQLREILLTATQENPQNEKAFIQLAKLYREDRSFALALATLKLGAETIQSAELYKAIALTYEQRAQANNCSYERRSDIVNSAKYYKLAIPFKPDDVPLRYSLASAFFDQQLNQLGLNESALALELNQQADDLAINAQQYSRLGMHSKAQSLLQAALNQGYNLGEAGVHEIYMNQGDWQNAAKSFDSYVKTHDSYTVYDLIKSDMIAQQSQQRGWIQNQKISLSSDWEEALFKFWSAKISADELKSRAHNVCEKTEYYFYTGYRDFTAGENALAKSKFTAALNQNTYRFIERPLARWFLARP